MNLSKSAGTTGLVLLATIAAPAAMAADGGWFGGIGVGQSQASIANSRITSELLAVGLATASINDKDTDTGYKVFTGYQFNRNFALEGGYFDLGKFGFTAQTTPAGTLIGEIKLRGVNFDLIGFVPMTENLSFFGRVGANYAQTRDTFRGTGAVTVINPTIKKYDTNYKAGLGMQYAFSPSLAMRLEGERYRINDGVGHKGDVDLASLSLVFYFDAKKPTPVAEPIRVAEAPVYVAPAPVVAPPPPPPPKPIPYAPKRVSFSADSLFGFDKSSISPEGKQQIDKMVSDLRGTTVDGITVTGHTDRIGKHNYNMKLSARRAEAVKAYLMESTGIGGEKIVATGVDGANPVTKPGDCKGTKVTKALIACLQPDRRVDLEVRGSR